MNNVIIILFLLACCVQQIYAQHSINGVVKNAEGGAVDFVSVIASPSNAPKTILASAFTDENGRFQMSVRSECDSLIPTFQMLLQLFIK